MPTAPTNANANHGIISTRKQRSLHLIAHIIRKRRDNPPTDSPEEATFLSPLGTKTFLLTACSNAFLTSGSIDCSFRGRPRGLGDGPPFFHRSPGGGRPGPTL